MALEMGSSASMWVFAFEAEESTQATWPLLVALRLQLRSFGALGLLAVAARFFVHTITDSSSDLLRLKTLLLSDDEDDDELNALAAVNDALRSAGLSDIAAKDASKRRRGNSSQSIKQKESGTARKTRLSWELHPSLLLHDLYYQVEEDVQSIPDDGDDHEAQQVQATPLSKFKE
eukprot:scaffold9244_cov141-Skeletonema_marinoi.AAC.2